MWAWNANTAVLAERGDQTTEGLVRSAIAYCRERGISFWEPVFSWNLAVYLIRKAGRHAEGLALMRPALAAHQATGSGNSVAVMFATVAEGCLGVGDLEDASAAVRAGLERVSVGDDHWGEPDLYRMSAELALARPTADSPRPRRSSPRRSSAARNTDQTACRVARGDGAGAAVAAAGPPPRCHPSDERSLQPVHRSAGDLRPRRRKGSAGQPRKSGFGSNASCPKTDDFFSCSSERSSFVRSVRL